MKEENKRNFFRRMEVQNQEADLNMKRVST